MTETDYNAAVGSLLLMIAAPALGTAYEYGYTPKALDNLTDLLAEVPNRFVGTNLSSLEGYGVLAAVGVIAGAYSFYKALYPTPEVKEAEPKESD